MNPSIFGAGLSVRSPAVTASYRKNYFYEIVPAAKKDRADVSIYGRPSIQLFSYLGANPIRGALVVDPYLYVVYGNTLYQIAGNGVATAIGALLTSIGPVRMASNITQLMLADNPNGYIYQIFGVAAASGQAQGTFAQIVAAGFLGAVDVTCQDNFFVTTVPATNPFTAQTVQASNVGDGTGWNGLSFDLASSDPDALVAVKGYQGTLNLIGTKSTERWANTGAPIFPFTRIAAVTQGWGCAALQSVTEFGDLGVLLLGQSRRGQAVPILLTPNGYPPENQNPLMDEDFVAAINGYATVADAVGGTYQLDGHRFWHLGFPTAGKMWAWDANTGLWSEYTCDTGILAGTPTGIQGPFRGALCEILNGQTLLFDMYDGHIWKMDKTQFLDNGVPITGQLVSNHLFQNDEMMTLNSLQIDMEEGVGSASGQGQNPQITLEVSKDKGRSWLQPRLAPIGAQGQYRTRVRFTRCGTGRDLTCRLTVTDPIKRVITGEVADLEVAA